MKLLLPLLVLLATACSSVETAKEDPAELYKEALQEIENDHYMLAIDKLREIKNKFPYSKFAIESQLKLGDVYFLQESYSEAAAVYESFRDLHPKHERVAHAMFRLGKSHFLDSPEIVSRDQASSERAIAAYNDFLVRFPNDPQSPEARGDVSKLESRLAEKEWEIGEFYFKRGKSDAAKRRFQRLVERFPKSDAAARARRHLDTGGSKP